MKKYKYFIIFSLILLVIIVNLKEIKKEKDKNILILLNNILENNFKGININEVNNLKEEDLFEPNSNLEEIYKIEDLGNENYLLERDFFINENKKFTFKLYGEGNIPDYSINQIEIYEDKNLLQNIFIKDILGYGTSSHLKDSDFSFEDINFDGYLDIKLNVGMGVANSTYVYWIFNSKENKFDFVGEYFEFDIDKENRQLISIYRISAGSYSVGFYKFDENNNLIIIKSETSESVKVNNKYIQITKTINMLNEKDYIIDIFYKDINEEELNEEDMYIKLYGERLNDYKYIEDNQTPMEHYILKKFEVYKSNKLVQDVNLQNIQEIKENIGSSIYQDFYFQLEDINFDGYLDFSIQINYIDYEQEIYSYWLWNNKKICFEYLTTKRRTL